MLAAEQQRHSLAEDFYRRALTVCEKACGAKSSEYARGLYLFAMYYRDQQRIDAAEPLTSKLIEIEPVETDPFIGLLVKENYADYLELHAEILEGLGRGTEAKAALDRANTIRGEIEKEESIPFSERLSTILKNRKA
jgi:tetratricopeptide (TPR) repeat protein